MASFCPRVTELELLLITSLLVLTKASINAGFYFISCFMGVDREDSVHENIINNLVNSGYDCTFIFVERR